jgi:sugar porter (SP) family MFS transporter
MLAGGDAVATRTPTRGTGEGAGLRLGRIWTISMVAALGGLLFGYDYVVIGGAKPFYERYFALTTPSRQGWAMSCALVGCLIGAVLSGVLADRLGRKRLLMAAAVVFLVSSLGTGLAPTFVWFVVSRIAGGVAIGLASNLSPLYIAEVAPAHLRGRLVSVNQLTIVIGILLAQAVNYLIANQIGDPVPGGATSAQVLASWNGQVGWRWMFGVTAVPSLLFFLAMFIVPESPRWLVKAGYEGRARGILLTLMDPDLVDREMDDVRASLAGSDDDVAGLAGVLDPSVRKVVIIGVILALFQQLCGFNVLLNYADDVFSSAGYSVSDTITNILITGVINLVFTFVAMRYVDRLGRRLLMLVGSGGLGITFLTLGFGYHTGTLGLPMLILVLVAIALFACSLGPVTWVYLSEIFPNRVRGAAMALSVFALWAGCFSLNYSFPFLKKYVGPSGSFWVYAGVCAAGFVFMLLKLPETKNKTLEQIEAELAGRRSPPP